MTMVLEAVETTLRESLGGSPVIRFRECSNLVSDCRKKLRWLIDNPPENSALPMIITPAMAQAMMERNKDDEWENRPQSKSGLKRYIRAMQQGWHYTGETIVFSASGRLLNGQHRLIACITSGQPFKCLVAFCVPEDAFKFMDIGITRTAAHIFAIEGIKNSAAAASVARILYSYYKNNPWHGGTEKDVENNDLLEFYWGHEDIQDSLKYGRMLGVPDKKNNGIDLLAPRWASSMHYICARKNKSQADEFFERISTGLGLTSKSDPVFKIRNKLTRNAALSAGNEDKNSDLFLAAYVVQAWNAMRLNDKRELFIWRGAQRPNQAFPRAV